MLLHKGGLLLEDVGGERRVLTDGTLGHLDEVPTGALDPIEEGMELNALTVVLKFDVIPGGYLRT